MAEEICRRRRKSLRDTYQREKKRESNEKRSECAAQSCCSSTCVLLCGRRVGTWGGGAEGRGSQDRRVQRGGESRGSSRASHRSVDK
ncbi:hypothetical protein EYF80_063369 [Liparis tanakae]|uniref:Uncharacterized protein n=1 Tax=Liparis tanakae TaxID=230148 RepID=A0A4Z2EDB3_9TELE|nr:hypothetical protein EYF80_063369 [Liparis tanakae]